MKPKKFLVNPTLTVSLRGRGESYSVSNDLVVTINAQKKSLAEEKLISQFISMLKHEESDVLCSLILKSIYTFMRDWTSVIVRNNLSLDRTNSCFDTALTLIKEIINSRPLKEKIKFLTKVIIIKAKNH